MLQEARSLYYYITYLHPQQLLHFLDFVEDEDGTFPTENLEHALKFVNPQFVLSMLHDVEVDEIQVSTEGLYEDLFGTLCSLGKFLHGVHSSLSYFLCFYPNVR